ncbi:MAG: FAD/NAD(P)-binding protein [Pyrinomonadaceae bacterium]
MAKRDNRATIAIIGGGLSGTLVAAHLLARKLMSDARRRPLRVVLIERAADQLGRGVAYGTSDRVHLLNVPACNMSAFADEPDHFLRWCDRRGISITRDTFVPRMIYGEYLPDVLQEAGYIAPDELSVGVEVTASGALVNHRGEESATLFTLGPWRRPLL